MQDVNRADPCSSFLNDLCAQYPWVFGRITLLAAMSMASWSGQTVNAAVVCALPRPHKPSVAAVSGDSVLSFSHVSTGFIKMTSGVEISPLWLKDDVMDGKSAPEESLWFLILPWARRWSVAPSTNLTSFQHSDCKPWTAGCHRKGRVGT